jgi:hypothetical protein
MKIKDILGEADVTLKPMPGAQEVDIDGKAVGTATTPAAATAISDLAKKGEFTPAGDEQTTSEDTENPYFVDTSSGKPMIKSGNGLTPVQPSKLWPELTPEVEAKAHSQGFRKIMISVNGKQMLGLEGGGKVIVSPKDFQAMSITKEVQSPFPSRNPGTPAAADAAAQAGAPAKPVQSAVYPSRNAPTQEGHKDLIRQGNKDVGGDATDRFIQQVRDTEFEKANKHGGASASRSTLSEKDELMKWLTIAGIK